MKRPLPYIFSLLLLLSSIQLYGQEDTIALTVNKGPSLYVDYGKLLTLPSGFETKAEAGISYRLKNKFAPNIQVGMARLEPSAAFVNATYTSEGIYGRVGVNYLIPFDPVNTLYAGLKYGLAMFEESGTYEIGSKLWPGRVESYSRRDLRADWFEIILGSEKKLRKSHQDTEGEGTSDQEPAAESPTHWSVGGYFTLRFLRDREKFTPIDTYSIPGYGRAFDRTVPGVNVYIRYEF